MGFGARVAILAALALSALCASPAAFATFPGENGKIAFSRDGDVWIMDPDGSNQEQITSGPAIDLAPRWAPDGSAIAFSRRKDEHIRVLIYELGGGLSRLGDLERVENPAWSPNGQRLAVSFLGAPNKLFDFAKLSIVSREGRVIRSGINDQANALDSDWSPLGDRIAYAPALDGMASIFSIDLRGTDSLSLSPGPRDLGDFTYDPSWAPDGSRVAFGHAQEEVCEDIGPNVQRCGWPPQIYIVDADGTDLTQLTALDGFNGDDTPAWSPDGDRIVYARATFSGEMYEDPVLRLMDANGGNVQDLGVVGTEPDWQPLVPPRNLSRPSLMGTLRSGQQLTAEPGGWFGTPELSYTYQWRDCGGPCEDIPGATNATYVLTEDDVGDSLRVFVTATNGQGASTAWSFATGTVGRTSFGTAAEDHMVGSGGGDLLRGLGGDDRLNGSYGDDFLYGGGGDDRVQGDFGSDHLIGGPGADRILGANDPQYTSVGDGRDDVRAGGGPDWIHVRDGRRDVVDCGRGQDTVLADVHDEVHGDCETVKIG